MLIGEEEGSIRFERLLEDGGKGVLGVLVGDVSSCGEDEEG